MKSKQQGMSMLAALCVLGVILFFATLAVRLAPIYLDYWTLSRIITDIAEEDRTTDATPGSVRKELSSRFITNRIESVNLKDIKISTDKKGIIIDARHEKRVPIMFNVDAVVHFDDAQFLVPRI
ncbi:DUF4845 domain-containing protein [Zhongshania borealis]|jgi:hypothetical protein|uniref:DUF4845 domain-containing protein n=1 Tax=Zhongshania borealis TaxID=889488 RepID=A0ABP7WH75_9GAMM|tara:strand:+ start:4420 stop:4791 length:372 start_codon:yes stop_codon:yes gene_type:complete